MTLRTLCVVFTGIFATVSAYASSASEQAPIDVHIYDRPPLFTIQDATHVSGAIAEPTAQIFSGAKIPFRWRISSSKAILQKIEDNETPICAPGWYKTAERELYAKYTLPIYQDGSRVLITRTNDPAIQRHDSLKTLMSDSSLKVGLKKAYTYGAYVGNLIKTASPVSVLTNQGEEGMIRMLAGHRFDYFMLGEEQASYFVDKLGKSYSVEIKRVSDAPVGLIRYILCSLKTTDSTIQHLNSSIQTLDLVP